MKAIIFDCFGVLVGKGFWNMYTLLGGDVKADSEYIDQQLAKVDLGQLSSQDFSQEMANRLGISIDKYTQAFREDERPNEALFAYIKDELKPNYKLALVSNATGDSVRRKIPADKLALFDEVLISGEVGILKPDPRLFHMALDRLGVEAHETVFVDDHQEYIQGAKNVGLQTIQFKDFDSFVRELQSL